MIIHFQLLPPVWLLPVPKPHLSPDLLQLGSQGNLCSCLPPFSLSSPHFSVLGSGGVGRRAEHSASSYLAGREFKVKLDLEGCFWQFFTEELFHQVDDACPLAGHTLSQPLWVSGGLSPGRGAFILQSAIFPVWPKGGTPEDSRELGYPKSAQVSQPSSLPS